MWCIRRFKNNGDTETIYKHESKKTVESYLNLVVVNNTYLKWWKPIRFLDGFSGWLCSKKGGGEVTYKIEPY